MSYLEIEDLEYRAGSFSLEVGLELEKGETGVLLGPSGCGKTSLLRCIAGLERPTAGEIRVRGRSMTALPPERRNFGYVFQDLALFDHLTGRGNMEFSLRLKGWDSPSMGKRVADLASRLRIGGLLDRKPMAMSGGERQRLAFARSLALSPDLLLLDEPLSSLDAPLRRELRAFLGESLRREEMTALHVTHDVEEAMELAGRIFLMRDGRIAAQGSPRELFSCPGKAWTVSFLGLGSLVPVRSIDRAGSLLRVETALGLVSMADRGSGLSGIGSESKHPMLFVPAKAVMPGRGTAGSLRFNAEVKRTVFAGTILKVAAEPLPPGLPGRADQFGAEPRFSIEFEAPSSMRLVPGDRMELSLDPGMSLLVSDDR